MKLIITFGLILLTILCLVLFVFALATLIPQIPYIGSIANFITIGFNHIWFPICVIIFIIILLISIKTKEYKHIYNICLILSSVTLLIAFITTGMAYFTLINNGIKTNLFLNKKDISGVNVETNVYTTSEYGDVELNVYYSEDNLKDKPVIIYIHGGGWVSGSKDNGSYYTKYFSKHGYVSISVDYDLSNNDRHLADTTELQIVEAFAWVKNNIANYGGNINRLYVIGDSAGGNLALDISYKINSGIYKESLDGTLLPQISAVSVLYPVSSLETFYNNNDLLVGGMAKNMVSSYTGCSPEENKELFDSLTPANYLSDNTPPTSILLGTNDTLVPPQATYDLSEKLEKEGINNQIIKVPFGNHIFDMVEGGMLSNAFIDITMKWFEQYH